MYENFQKAYETQLQHSNEWFKNLRTQNFQQFQAQGLPTKRREEWKYTDVTAIAQQAYQLGESAAAEISQDLLQHSLPNAYTLIFVNGHFVPPAKTTLPKQLILTNLFTALEKYPEKIQPILEKKSTYAFELLNTALLQDGAFICIPKNVQLDKPIQLLFLSTGKISYMQHVRNIILIEENAIAEIVESYIGATQEKYFNNTVTEILVGANAAINYYKNQCEAEFATHISNINITQQQNSTVQTHSFSFGAQLAREDLNIKFTNKGASCNMYGLYLTNKQQHIDHHTRVDHFVPNCASYELYKGILTDKSRAVFNGKALVHRDAQQTRIQQINQNILLTKTAEVNTKPELEIYADNVQCAHGATVGQIDEQALFYLRSRGIELKKAEHVLTFAFASEVTDAITNNSIREYFNNYLRLKLKNSTET